MFVYLDDMLVAHSPSAVQHERDLRQLFDTLRRFGLVLNVNKCIFGMRDLEFLGHIRLRQKVSDRLKKSSRQCSAVLRACGPSGRFLGMVNFYKRFLPGIAGTMRPLTYALAGAPEQLNWTEAMTTAFRQTKRRLASATLLVHPVPDAELHVNTDASLKAIAGVIHQVVQGRLQPLGFFSRRTSPAESRYSAYDLELLAVNSTILMFRHVFEGRRFRMYTDQKPLTCAFF